MCSGRRIRVDIWFGNRRQMATVSTVCSEINNMITGVTKVRPTGPTCLRWHWVNWLAAANGWATAAVVCAGELRVGRDARSEVRGKNWWDAGLVSSRRGVRVLLWVCMSAWVDD